MAIRNRANGSRSGNPAIFAAIKLFAVILATGAAPQPPAPEIPFEVLSDWQHYNTVGWQALDRGKLDRAEQAFRIAIKRMKPYEATKSILLARSYADLARVLHLKGRHDDAEPLARWALSVREKSPGKQSEALCQSLELLAEIEVARKQDALAEPLLIRVIGVREGVVGPGHTDLIAGVENLAEVLAREGKLKEAERYYRRGLALRESNHEKIVKEAEEAEQTARTLRTIIAADSGSPSSAGTSVLRSIQVERFQAKARTIREASPESISAAVTTQHYAGLLRRSGRNDEADELDARARAIRDAVETKAAAAGR